MEVIVQATHYQNLAKRDSRFALKKEQTHAQLCIDVNTVAFISGICFIFMGFFLKKKTHWILICKLIFPVTCQFPVAL